MLTRLAPGLFLACLVAFSWQCYRHNTTQDDTYISLVYAKHLAMGEGLVFNPGERVEGYTNFLWTLVLALPHIAGLDAVWTAKALGYLAACATFFLLFWHVRRQRPDAHPLAHLPAPALLATCGAFAFWALSGMETALFAFLL